MNPSPTPPAVPSNNVAPITPDLQPTPWRRALLYSLLILALLLGGAMAIRPDPHFSGNLLYLTTLYARVQDLPVAVITMTFLAIAFLLRKPSSAPPGRSLVLSPWMIGAGLIAFALFAWALRIHVLFDLDLSRDEQMARFDAGILGSGHLFQTVPAVWRPFFTAFNDEFLLTIGDHEGWVSNYLPGNAALLATLGTIIPSALVFPLLTATGGVALWSIARHLWPQDRSAQTLVLILFLGSSQVLLTATTTYAMSAHLALNLVWLALFLRNRPWSHGLALLVGLLATGLHQPIFHPLFVAPFFLAMLLERRFGLLAVYLAGYLAIALVWLVWPIWIAGMGSHPPLPGHSSVGFGDRLLAILKLPSATSLWVQCANALRFLTWQHLALLPLVLAGLPAVRRDPLALALALGLVGIFAALFILLPLQGHGWGYRYAHGFIGNACLLAGYGWRRLERLGQAPRTFVLLASLLTFAVLVPTHIVMARTFIAPVAQAQAVVRNSGNDVTIVENDGVAFGNDLVINAPDLSNRPLRLGASELTVDEIRTLCRTHRLSFVTAPELNPVRRLYEQPPRTGPSPTMERLMAAAAHLDCIAQRGL